MPASRKLGRDDAAAMAADATKLIVAKGKKVSEFDLDSSVPDEALTAMLGPTGNLRAPTLRIGSLLIVGFNDDIYRRELS